MGTEVFTGQDFYTGSFKKIWTIKTRSREEYHITNDQIWRTIHCWMEPHATITVTLGTSLTRHCRIDGLEEQSTVNIFYSTLATEVTGPDTL